MSRLYWVTIIRWLTCSFCWSKCQSGWSCLILGVNWDSQFCRWTHLVMCRDQWLLKVSVGYIWFSGTPQPMLMENFEEMRPRVGFWFYPALRSPQENISQRITLNSALEEMRKEICSYFPEGLSHLPFASLNVEKYDSTMFKRKPRHFGFLIIRGLYTWKWMSDTLFVVARWRLHGDILGANLNCSLKNIATQCFDFWRIWLP